MARAADAPVGLAAEDVQTGVPDRISFYNVPSDHKLESHLDYADGRAEKIKYPAALCASGTVITQQLNLYTVTFVAEGCEATVFQHLNLRWLGDCRFEFEHDPDAHIVARGPYGEIGIADGHYPAGEFQLTNLPANTTSLSATMSLADAAGHVQTGNVEFAFHEPHPGCGQAPTPTSTDMATPTATIEIAMPTNTPTPITTIGITTPTSTATPTNAAMLTATIGITTPLSTATPTATSTETTIIVIPTATPSSAVLPPTGLDPIDEPGVPSMSRVYLPLVVN